MSRRSRESLLKCREGLGGPPGGTGGVRRSSRRVKGVGRPSWMVGRGQNGREGLGVPPGGLGGLEGSPRGPRGFGSPLLRAGNDWKKRERSGVLPGGLGEVSSPSRRAGRGQ